MSFASTDLWSALPRRSVTLERPTAKSHALVAVIAVSAKLLAPFRHRGYWDVCKRLGRHFGDDEFGRICLADDAVFRIRLSDPYWNRLIGHPYDYEPEIAALLARLKNLNYTFIDCGANHGYWSILATSPTFGCKRAVAIEPFADSFRMLNTNNSLNGSRFATLQRAVAAVGGADAVIRYHGNHAEVGIVSEQVTVKKASVRDEMVSTITLDDVFESYVTDKDKPLVIKLDVEGNEIESFSGAERILSCDPLIIYEDHGRDPECTVTQFVLEELNRTILHIDDAGRIAEMRSIDNVRNVKTLRSRGYNFIALERNSQFRDFLMG